MHVGIMHIMHTAVMELQLQDLECVALLHRMIHPCVNQDALDT